MRKRALVAFFVASTAIVTVMGACGGAQVPGTSSGTASQSIGPSGGTVETSSGASLTFGSGAVSSDTTITITETASAPIPAHTTAVGTPYVFGPEGAQFAKPVTLTLPYTASLIPAGKSASDIVVFTAPVGSTSFTALTTTLTGSSDVSATTTHFSVFVPCIVDEGGADAGVDASLTCTSDDQCPTGDVCVANECALGDVTTRDASVDASLMCESDDECPTGDLCVGNQCVPGGVTTSDASVDATSTCVQDTDCPDGEICQDDLCVPISARDGGASDASFDAVTTVEAGDAEACPGGETLCSSTCVDLTSNLGNCGACGAVCDAGTTCTAGVCSG